MRKGAEKVRADIDIVNIALAIRKINNLTDVMLTQNQYQMLENQKRDLINSESDEIAPDSKKVM